MSKEQNIEEVFLGRQPIMDRNQQLVAYELLFRNGRQNFAVIDDNVAATAQVMQNAFAELGIETALGPYKGYINCDETILLSCLIDLLPADKIVLEILEIVEISPRIVERCRELKQRGFTLALDDFTHLQDKHAPLLDVIDIVKVDIMQMDRDTLKQTTLALQKWPVQLLAEKVDSFEQAAFCHALGYALFQGYYFAKPTIVAGKKLSHSQIALLQLLNLALEDADVKRIEAVLKHEAGLTVNLMRLSNSAAVGARTKVASMRHAITILGRRQFQRWLQLLLYTNPAGGASTLASPLLQLAATRGRFMELLAPKVRSGDHEFEDQAFMCGILSLMPTLMSIAMSEILASINLATNVREALESHSGTLGQMLQLAEALENGDGATCHMLTAQLNGIDAHTVNACLTQALSWASRINEESQTD